jgi:hypothetical protein
MPMARFVRGGVILAATVVVATAAILHLDLSLPVSSMNGRWQIQDWFDHPQATAETRREYTEARRQYPRTVVVKPFGHALVGSRSDCHWTQQVVGWPDSPPLTDVWATTIFCPGMAPIRLWATPHNVYTRARSLSGLREYYSDMNDEQIEVMFQIGGATTYIDYIPASWPMADTTQSSMSQGGSR